MDHGGPYVVHIQCHTLTPKNNNRKKSRTGALDALERPVALLATLNDLLALISQVRAAAVADSMLKVHGRPGGAVGLALAGLDTLRLLELLLDRRGLGELLGVDRGGDVTPESERLVGELLVGRRDNLGGDAERGDVDNRVLLFSRDSFL